ncbi:MAG TPA: class I tRNA ligase family protein, partial [Rhodothermales bacterium]|nr:class I tRNA ligase family protein [Rhodothermales bacterium]
EQYGADAVRYSLVVLNTPGQDIKLDPLKFEMGRNFANKIWNAFNVFGQFMESGRDYRRQRSFDELEMVEQWILTRLNSTITEVNDAIERYRLNEALTALYGLFWHDYCDWYLELIKPPMGEALDEDKIALAVEVYETMMQLLHPFMPFITEALWHRLRPREQGASVMVTAWPEANPAEADQKVAEQFGLMQEMISGVRNVRNEYSVAPSREISAIVTLADGQNGLLDSIESHRNYFQRLARIGDMRVGRGLEKPQASASVVVGPNEVFVPLAGMIDLDVERARLGKEIDQKQKFLQSVQQKLRNDAFISRAPEEVVVRERQKEADAVAELDRLRASLENLG